MTLPTNIPPSAPSLSYPTQRHIWVIIGPSGCGKTTAAEFLAGKLHLPYIEGDDLHPPQNIQKMSNGIPLTDNDRWEWLETLRDKAADAPQGCVVACSCLKRRYRNIIRLAGRSEGVVVRFIYLSLTKELVLQRVRARGGHFFSTDEMVYSQFETLEEPGVGELDVVSVDASGSRGCVGLKVLEVAMECMNGGE